MTTWDETVDFLIVGSGGGSMCAALACKDLGKTPLILEKEDKVGGSTAMSGGVFWVPGNALMAKAGVKDSYEQGLTYLNAVVGDKPGSSLARKDAYLRTGPKIVEWLESKGVRFIYCDGWSDYYDELPGGQPRGRSLSMPLFDVRRLGPWRERLRHSPWPYPTQGTEAYRLALAKRTLDGFLLMFRIGWRKFVVRLLGKQLVGAGGAVQSSMLLTALKAGVDLRLQTPVVDLVVEEDRVVGVVAERDGKTIRIKGRDGVLINAGGFARNAEMRRQYGPQPSSTEWTHSNPGDTGEMIRTAMGLGADVVGMERAIWTVTSLLPNGKLGMHANELGKPHLIVVNKEGKRFTDEAGNYMETGDNIYRAGGVPCWAILDSRHRDRYNWAKTPPGIIPSDWASSGYMKKADTLEELAAKCGIDPAGLKETVERFNGFAATGKDLDFKRGDRAYDRFLGDPTHKPNPCLGAIEKPPFLAFELYPGDVGTYGGLMTDEFGRVLRKDGSVIAGLYATGNSTASVTADKYPGAGASIAASFIFAYLAVQDAYRSNSALRTG